MKPLFCVLGSCLLRRMQEFGAIVSVSHDGICIEKASDKVYELMVWGQINNRKGVRDYDFWKAY